MTTFVLLRGLAREAGHWGDVARRLRRRLGDSADVVALDLPGNGLRHREHSAPTVDGLVAACRDELQRRGVEPPLVLVAMSLGAMVAVQWSSRAPHEVAGCVLVNTSLRGISPFWQRLRPSSWPRLLALLAPGGSAAQRERLVLALTSSDPGRHPDVLRQLLAAARYRAPLRHGVPTLVLASAGDTLVDPRCSAELALRWQLPMQVHPSAGHDLPLDDPQWFVSAVATWWSGLREGHGTAT
jgi:pimeloyl-ACP methyl ester carboxylesterase